MNDMKFISVAFDAKRVSEAGTFDGYLSTFGNIDLGQDIVAKGAFINTLASGRAIKLLWQHDTSDPIGIWSGLREDEKGLVGMGQLALETQRGRETLALMKMGAVDGISIGGRTKAADFDMHSGVRTIKEFDLYEASVVTFPMNPLARVTGVKATDFNPREAEADLREAGLSRSDAVKAVAYIRKTLLREAGDEPAIDPRDADTRHAADIVSAAQSLLATLRA